MGDTPQPSDVPRQLLERAIAAYETSGEEGLAAVLENAPEHAAEVRRRIARLGDLGFLQGSRDDVEEVERRIGRFRLLGRLGAGSMGLVELAHDERLDRPVAIKSLPPGHAASSGMVQRLRREARAVAGLQHPSIVAVHELGEDDGHHFLVTDFVDGVTLSGAIAGLRDRFGEGTEVSMHAYRETLELGSQAGVESSYVREAARVTHEIARALSHAHAAGVLHRDVKPSNVMIDRAGTPRLLDFGLASLGDDPSLTASGDFVGTARYVAPEMATLGGSKVDARADVFSLGATLYELLTLRSAFRGASATELIRDVIERELSPPSRANPNVPADLDAIALTALAKDPDRRYASARAFADDLKRFLRGEEVQARRPSALARAARWVRRRPAKAALIGVLGALSVAVPVSLGVVNVSLRESEARAQSSAESARSSIEFLAELLELSDVEELGPDVTARTLLTNGAQRVRDAAGWSNTPLVRATAARILGALHFGIEELDVAVELLGLASSMLAEEPPALEDGAAWALERARASNMLGNAFRFQRQDEKALAAYEDAIVAYETAAGLAKEERVLEIQQSRADSLANVAGLLLSMRRVDEAEARASESVALASSLERTDAVGDTLVWTLQNLSGIQVRQERFEEAALSIARAREVAATLAPRPTRDANLLDAAGRLAMSLRRFTEAAELFDQQRLIIEEESGADSWIVGKIWLNIGVAREEEDADDLAQKAYQRADAVLASIGDGRAPDRCRALLGLATYAFDDGEVASARKQLDLAFSISRERPELRTAKEWAFLHLLDGRLLRFDGRLPEAEEAFARAETHARDGSLSERDLAWIESASSGEEN